MEFINNNYCFICFENPRLLNLITDIDENNMSWMEKLRTIVSHLVFQLSCKLCKLCCREIDRIIKFRMKCIESMEMDINCAFENHFTAERSSISLSTSDANAVLSKSAESTEILNNYEKHGNSGSSLQHSNYFDIEEYTCDMCSKNFRLKKSLEEHISICSLIYKKSCLGNISNVADIRLVKNKLIQIEKKRQVFKNFSVIPSQFVCEICNKLFKYKHTLRNHKENVHVDRKDFSCTKCTLLFTSNLYLREHVRRQHSESYKEPPRMAQVCPICGKMFKKLDDHKKVHENKKTFKCDQCTKSFNTSGYLRSHKVVVHMDPETWKYSCSECNKKFPFSGALKIHMSKHAMEKKYTCYLCNSQFKQKVSVKSHLVSHANERRYKCKKCHKDFNRIQNLKIHEARLHGREGIKVPIRFKTVRGPIGEKPFKCDLCEKRFSQEGYMKRHKEKIHCDTLQTKM